MVEVINLLTAGREQVHSFSKRVRKNNGTLGVLVHPLFTGVLGRKFPVTDQYHQSVGDLVNKALDEEHPLIVFESIESSQARLDLLADRDKGVLYYVPTLFAEPTPAVFGRQSLIYSLPLVETFCWNKLGDRFRRMGAQNIELGGRYMVLHPPESETDEQILKKMRGWANKRRVAQELVDSNLVPDCCVGAAMYFLLGQGFDVSISEASSPTNKLEATDLSGLEKDSEAVFF